MERSGGCMCGAIRYVSVGEPERVTVCHCTWCQRRTGTAFGTEVVFRKEQLVFSGIELSRHRHVSDESGRWLEVYFCPRCGTHLGFTLEGAPDVRTIPAGSYDDSAWLSPKRYKFRQVFARSRRDWGEVTSEVKVYEKHFR